MSWDPSQLPSILTWLRADRAYQTAGTGTPCTDGTGCYTASDGSSHANDAVQATSGNRPTWKTSIVNGQPILRLNGTSSYMSCPSVNPTTTGASGSVVASYSKLVVFNPTGTTGFQNLLSGGNGATPNQAFWLNNSAFPAIYHGGASRVVSSVGVTASAWNVAAGVVACNSDAQQQDNKFHIWTNGQWGGMGVYTDQGQYTNDPAVNLGTFGLGAGSFFHGDIAEAILTGTTFSAADANNLASYLNTRYALSLPTYARQIVFHGDSITTGYKGNPGFASLVATNFSTSWSLNFGVGGQLLTEMTTAAPTLIDPLISSGVKNVLVVFAGTNDIVNGGVSGATAYSRLLTYCAPRRAAGWKIVVVTMLPRGSAGNETDRQTYNTSIRNNWATFADALADVGNDSTIGQAGQNTNTTNYDADTVHLNTTGHAIAAPYIETAITSITAGAPWDPSSLSGLALWLEATTGVYHDAGITLALNSQTVQQWNDQSGNGRNYALGGSATGANLTFVTGSVNGLPVVRFTGSTWLHNAFSLQTYPTTIWVVTVRQGNGSSSHTVPFFAGDNPGVGGMGIYYTGGGNLNQLTFLYPVTPNFTPTQYLLPLSTVAALEAEYTGTLGGAATVTGYVNGYKACAFNFTSPASLSAVGTNICSDHELTAFTADADICEIVVQTGGTSSADRANMLAYFKSRWGITQLALPTSSYYLYSGFTGTSETLNLFAGTDGVNFTQYPATYTIPAGSVRDPSLLFYNSKWWMAYTKSSLSGGSNFGIASSPDLVTWTHVVDPDVSSISGSTGTDWSPEWFLDPADNIPRVLVSLSATLDTSVQLYEMHATDTTGLTTWSAPAAITGTSLPSNVIAGMWVKIGSTYYIWYKNETTKYIEVLSSSSLTSGYTVLHSGDWAGWGPNIEGTWITKDNSGVWTLYVDFYGAATGIHYSRQTAGDWTTGTGTWSAMTAIQTPYSTSGTNSGTRNGQVQFVPVTGVGTAIFRNRFQRRNTLLRM